MIVADLVVAFIYALVIVFVSSRILGSKGPWNDFIWFFLVVFLFAWAGGVWIRPFGPQWYGVGWLAILLMGFVAALLIIASSSRSLRGIHSQKRVTAPSEGRAALEIVFWILIIFLVFFGSAHYWFFSPAT